MLVWCDLETTGLDPKKGSILEIALIATDDNLEQIGEPFVSLVKPIHLRGYEVMNDFVKDMHTKSGLLERLYAFPPGWSEPVLLPNLPRLGDVERAAIEWVKARALEVSTGERTLAENIEKLRAGEGLDIKKYMRGVPFAGNTVHFDKRWLIEHMDEFEALFSHRIFDVSVMTEFAKRYAPTVYAGRPGLGPDDKPLPAHRALDDIMNSIATARYYRDQFGRSA